MNNKQWKAIYDNDSNYDGHFYYALGTTKTVCRPSCTARTPNPKNVTIFKDIDEAIEKGFRPCYRCKPDQLDWKGHKKELVAATKNYIDCYYEAHLTLNDLSDVLQKNVSYIQRAFKEVMGISPIKYLHEVRIHKAKQLLQNHSYSITEIGLEVGYSDSAHFSTKFKELEEQTPKEFRRKFLDLWKTQES
ncbi:bifunctional transcriptional activator/DNA repair enzyme AdaA [Salicibibacter kimchii]|uniref:Helix-turn-helix domain-containing protein n=1 Tax=Salicibibacter kimchii TaxID=2099786 RepID=A0A345C389_9BACI|nr:Ada metal-binding domain-containing protein [Salicibibacter kimchii]AXF57670.1 helix-turn-helix domain-containing protein [Salicibibacter kimchii]